MTATSKHIPVKIQQKNDSLAIASMVLGTVSLTGFGFILGIPAIILASISLKNKAGERSLSIVGLVTGIISTALSLLFVAFFLILMLFSVSHPNNSKLYSPQDSTNSQVFIPRT